MKKLNVTFCSYPDFSGNAKALYDYMFNRYSNNMNYLWVVYNENNYKVLLKKGIDVVLIGSSEFKKKIKRTNIFFTTTGNLDGDKQYAKNSYYVELWHGVGPKPSGFAQDNPSLDDIKGYGHIGAIADYFIVPSEFWRIIFSSMFKCEFSRVLNLGLPLINYFTSSNGEKNLSKIIGINKSQYSKCIMYMPTFKKGFNHNDINEIYDNIFNFKNDFPIEALNKFLVENNYLLCVKYHPGDAQKYEYKSNGNIIFINEDLLQANDLSINEIINSFDLLITDFSSIGTEFIYLNRPVLFATGNLNEYLDNRGVYFGNYNFWTPGPICDNFDSLIKEMKKLLNDSSYFEYERNKCRELWFDNLSSDGGCKKICDFFFDNYQISKNVKHYINEMEIERNELLNVIKNNDECIKAQQDDIDFLHNVIKDNDSCIKAQQDDIDFLHNVIKENDEHINNLQQELQLIKNSKLWKLRTKIKK